jgi:hypothetical protein
MLPRCATERSLPTLRSLVLVAISSSGSLGKSGRSIFVASVTPGVPQARATAQTSPPRLGPWSNGREGDGR